MALPKLTDAQRKEALKKALKVRQERAQLKADLKKKKIKLADVLKRKDPVVAKMKVASLLQALPKMGKVRAGKLMEEIGIGATRRIQGLGDKQKEALLKKLA